MSDDLLDSRDGARTPTSDAFRTLLQETWTMYARERRLGAVTEQAQSQRDTAVLAFEELQKTSGRLNREVQVWREGYDTKCKAVEALEAELAVYKKRFDDINNSLVVCLIDGDGTIFAPEYLSDGQQGGRRAAQALNTGLLECLSSDGVARSGVRIIVNLYVNKLGLRTTLARANLCSTQQYDSFWDGFQATSLFSIIDVGQSKEAADAKIRDTLDLYARMPQVSRVFLGAAHDGGYHAPLSALQLDGLINKVVLLRGYNEEIAKDLRKLALKEAQLGGLFMAKRIDNNAIPTPIVVTPPTNGPTTQQHTTVTSSSISLSFGKPCYMHYLRQTCVFGDRCFYEHHRSFTEAELVRLQIVASGMPCTALIHGRQCPFGSANCPMQHKCRFLQQCFHLKNGNCRWSAPGMHDPEPEPEVQDTTGAPAAAVQPTTPPSIPSPEVPVKPMSPPPARKRYIVCLIDGHKYIMSHTLMNAGRRGGQDAARKLETALREHAGPSATDAVVAVIVFGDMAYLKEALPKVKACSPVQLEAFWAGFKEHSDEFGLLDVETDKIPNRFNELLLAYARRQDIPQAYLAIDGTSYSHAVIRVLAQEGHSDKLVLIRASDQPRSELTDITLTELRVKGLFVKPKPPAPVVAVSAAPLVTTPPSMTSPLFLGTGPLSPPRAGFSQWLAEVEVTPDRHSSLDSTSTSQTEPFKVDRPPCNFHYVLGNCTVGESACSYSHTKIFAAAEIQKLQRLAKTSPCLFENKGKPCPHGDERCCMLHRCPSGPQCSRFIAGAWCKFSGPKMHAA